MLYHRARVYGDALCAEGYSQWPSEHADDFLRTRGGDCAPDCRRTCRARYDVLQRDESRNVCGCVGFVQRVTNGTHVPNVIVADYTHLTHSPDSIDALKAIGTEERNQIEAANSFDIAAKLLGRLPRNERDVDEMIERGYEIAKKMSWEVVVEDYFLPGLHRALQNQA